MPWGCRGGIAELSPVATLPSGFSLLCFGSLSLAACGKVRVASRGPRQVRNPPFLTREPLPTAAFKKPPWPRAGQERRLQGGTQRRAARLGVPMPVGGGHWAPLSPEGLGQSLSPPRLSPAVPEAVPGSREEILPLEAARDRGKDARGAAPALETGSSLLGPSWINSSKGDPTPATPLPPIPCPGEGGTHRTVSQFPRNSQSRGNPPSTSIPCSGWHRHQMPPAWLLCRVLGCCTRTQGWLDPPSSPSCRALTRPHPVPIPS